MIGIYKITNQISGKVYIGQSIDIERRWRHHRGSYAITDNRNELYQDMIIYGKDNFSFEVIKECSADELNYWEKYYIRFYDSFNNGYNMTIGGMGIVHPVKLSDLQVDEIITLLRDSEISQKEIALRFDVGQDTISEINHGKTRRRDNISYPIRVNWGKRKLNQEKSKTPKRKVENRPSREELKDIIRTSPFTSIGKKYNVSDNAIRKWCDSYGLPRKKSIINSYSDKEWEAI